MIEIQKQSCINFKNKNWSCITNFNEKYPNQIELDINLFMQNHSQKWRKKKSQNLRENKKEVEHRIYQKIYIKRPIT